MAHGGWHEEIERLNQEIKEDSSQCELFLKRGAFYQLDRNLAKAYEDFAFAQAIDRNHPMIHYHMAMYYAAKGQMKISLRHINLFVQKNPESPLAYSSRADIYDSLNRTVEAQEDRKVLLNTPMVSPVLFVELSQKSLLINPKEMEESVSWMEKGLASFPNNVYLLSQSVQIFRIAGQTEKSVQSIDQLLALQVSPGNWLNEKAEILKENGDCKAALVAVNEAITYHEGRSNNRANSPARLATESKTYLLQEELKAACK